jgi:hypothetical protein
MDWNDIYDGTVRHMLPGAAPYAGSLRAFVLTHRLPLWTWIGEARAMLDGHGRARDPRDLEMLAGVMERTSMVTLPAEAMAALIEDAVARNGRDLAIGLFTFDGLARMTPPGADQARTIADAVARRVVRHATTAADALREVALNRARRPGSRVDVTSMPYRSGLDPVCEMAWGALRPALPSACLARSITTRLAA